MVQLAGPRKRPAAEQAADGAHVPPPGVVKEEEEEVEECLGDGNVFLHKRVKEAQEPSPPPQDMYCDVLDECSPLGLRLKKSPSLVDLIQMKLSQAKSAAGQPSMDNSISEPPIKKEMKSGSLTAGERLKASNFPANFLKIGTWEYTSQYEGDLVAKCYYAKHKLVWEVLDAGLKSKIEIQWAHITALKATCPEDGDGTLDLVLARAPLFFKETDPQPRKHTLWQAALDFTGGAASLHRRHILQCPSSLLSKNFEKLIQCDQRLNQLSQQPDIILGSPIFEPRSCIFESPNESDAPLPKFTHPASPCAVSKDGVKNLILKQPEFFAQTLNLGTGAADVHANVVAQEQKNPNLLNQLTVPGLRSSMSVDDLVNHLGNCMAEQRTAGNEAPSEELLGEIAQFLFSDAQGPPASDEKYLMARVDSFYSLLEKDTAPAAIRMPELNNGGSIVVGEVDSDDFDEELRSCFENEELGSAPASKTADGTEPPAISRKDSFAELLQNLPQIASVPQFLFDIAEDSDNSGSHS